MTARIDYTAHILELERKLAADQERWERSKREYEAFNLRVNLAIEQYCMRQRMLFMDILFGPLP